MSFHIFSKIGLIDHFRINPVYFRNYFETIESGYHNLPCMSFKSFVNIYLFPVLVDYL